LENDVSGKEKALADCFILQGLKKWEILVELTGFEPATSSAGTKRIQFLAIDNQWLRFLCPFHTLYFPLDYRVVFNLFPHLPNEDWATC